MPATYLTNEQTVRSNYLDHVQFIAERADQAHREGSKDREQRALAALEVAVAEIGAYVSTETE